MQSFSTTAANLYIDDRLVIRDDYRTCMAIAYSLKKEGINAKVIPTSANNLLGEKEWLLQ